MDTREFMRADLKPRTLDVPVVALAPWNGGVPLIVTVRGLAGPEFARARDAAERNKNVGKMIEALAGGSDKEKVAALREVMGISDSLPEDFAKRIEMLTIGAVSPPMDLEFCLRLATAFPVEFYDLTNKILELTGAGHSIQGKPQPSTETAASEQV